MVMSSFHATCKYKDHVNNVMFFVIFPDLEMKKLSKTAISLKYVKLYFRNKATLIFPSNNLHLLFFFFVVAPSMR